MATATIDRNNLVQEGGVRIADAIKFTGLSRGTIYTLIRNKTLPTSKVGRARIIPLAALRKLLADGIEE